MARPGGPEPHSGSKPGFLPDTLQSARGQLPGAKSALTGHVAAAPRFPQMVSGALPAPRAMLETCGSAGKGIKEGAPSRMMIES
jgi:hypothetical protein